MQDSDVADILRQAKYLEDEFSHFFDHTLAMKDIEIAYHNVVQLAQLLRVSQQWVPVHWLEWVHEQMCDWKMCFVTLTSLLANITQYFDTVSSPDVYL